MPKADRVALECIRKCDDSRERAAVVPLGQRDRLRLLVEQVAREGRQRWIWHLDADERQAVQAQLLDYLFVVDTERAWATVLDVLALGARERLADRRAKVGPV